MNVVRDEFLVRVRRGHRASSREDVGESPELAAVFGDCLCNKGENSVFVSKIAAVVDSCGLHCL